LLAKGEAMANPRVVLCPGQGAQVVGMGKAWAAASPEARAVFDEADRVLGSRLGKPLSSLCFEGPVEVLNQTDVSQPALYTCAVASWRGLLAKWQAGSAEEAGLVAAAGLSLGEYSALHVAGAFDFATGLELVALRGRAMQDAAVAQPSGMVALIGGDEAQARQVCAEALAGGPGGGGGGGGGGEVLVCANFNAPGQVVISGSKAACERSVGVAERLGLRATVLAVAGAFHSPIMAPAAERLAGALKAASISPPRVPVISNVTAKAHAAEGGLTIVDSIRRRLVEQLTAPVRWAESCQALSGGAAPAGSEYHELAPGRTLMGLMRRIDKAIKVETHDEP
jgi:[acyl-carrier-protein] S-malonyltransferase